MSNPLLALIEKGRITSSEQLKSAYRSLVMKTHPDAVGSNRLVEAYILLSSQYEEAKRFLDERGGRAVKSGRTTVLNHRLAYFQILQRLELIDKPYSFHRRENARRIEVLKAEARFHFDGWSSRHHDLYENAEHEYDRLKEEKPASPGTKEDLAITISPIFYNIVTYHLTGIEFYRKQVQQNLAAILLRLAGADCTALKELIELLIRDMNNGAAVFGEGRRIHWNT